MGTGETRALLSAPRGSRSSSHCPPPSALQGCPHAPPPFLCPQTYLLAAPSAPNPAPPGCLPGATSGFDAAPPHHGCPALCRHNHPLLVQEQPPPCRAEALLVPGVIAAGAFLACHSLPAPSTPLQPPAPGSVHGRVPKAGLGRGRCRGVLGSGRGTAGTGGRVAGTYNEWQETRRARQEGREGSIARSLPLDGRMDGPQRAQPGQRVPARTALRTAAALRCGEQIGSGMSRRCLNPFRAFEQWFGAPRRCRAGSVSDTPALWAPAPKPNPYGGPWSSGHHLLPRKRMLRPLPVKSRKVQLSKLPPGTDLTQGPSRHQLPLSTALRENVAEVNPLPRHCPNPPASTTATALQAAPYLSFPIGDREFPPAARQRTVEQC